MFLLYPLLHQEHFENRCFENISIILCQKPCALSFFLKAFTSTHLKKNLEAELILIKILKEEFWWNLNLLGYKDKNATPINLQKQMALGIMKIYLDELQ